MPSPSGARSRGSSRTASAGATRRRPRTRRSASACSPRSERDSGSSVGRRWYTWAVLLELRIENLLLIERAELRPGAGLTAITGETGAGKTVLAHALDLLLGGKARP